MGVGELTDDVIKSAEKFVCRIYNLEETDSVDVARHKLFYKAGRPEILPPISDALGFHLIRVHYQILIWRSADCGLQVFLHLWEGDGTSLNQAFTLS